MKLNMEKLKKSMKKAWLWTKLHAVKVWIWTKIRAVKIWLWTKIHAIKTWKWIKLHVQTAWTLGRIRGKRLALVIGKNCKAMFLALKQQLQTPKIVKFPTKRSINPARREQDTRSIVTLSVGIVLICLLSFGVAKFGVIDQLERQREAEAKYNVLHAQYLKQQEQLSRYDEVELDYQTHSRNWMNSDNGDIFVSVDRMKVIALLEDHLLPSGQVKSVTVQGNVLIAKMSGMNLTQVSEMIFDLQQEPIVKNAELSDASTGKESPAASLEFSIIITLQPEEAES